MSRGLQTFRHHNVLTARTVLSFCIFMFGLCAILPAHAQSASKWNKRGVDAEAHEDYDAAYEDYRQALKKSPKDIRFKTHLERMRFQAAVSHIDRGRVLRQSGDYSGALTNFMRAAEIDPGNQTAQQEIGITQREQPAPVPVGPGADAAAAQLTQQTSVLQNIASISAPVVLKPTSSDRQTLHMVEDVKNIYQAIGKLAGINVIFDPEYTSKRIPIDLTNVTLDDALRIVGTISGTFYKPVTSNTIFVAQNTRTKRTDLDELAVQTFYLSNSAQANDGNEILTGLRLLLDPTVKLYLVPSQNAIVMRGTTDELLLAQKLINDFDRARPEVVVDVAVLEVSRDKVRTLGITLPQSIGLTPQLSNANSTSTTSSTTTTSTTTTSSTTTSSTSSLTLNNLAHLNATNFAVSITGGTLNALLTDGDTRILQNPRIRATDGQRATLKIGSKIPIATGSYNAGVSTGVASIGVQTQFTYIDVGVNIDITPTVHYDREVSMKMKIEVSSQSNTVVISGVSEPIISQRISEQVIQVQDGEPSILAGILTHQDSKTVSGTPFLGELPFFKYFFSTQSKETQQDELVFLIIPHVVRESVLTRLNTAMIDTGTGSSIELRHMDTSAAETALSNAAAAQASVPLPQHAGAPSTAANAAANMLQQIHQDAQPPTPGQMPGAIPPTPAATAAPAGTNGPISLTVVPASSNQTVGSTFQAAVNLQNGRDVFSVPLQVQYDPKVLELVNVDAGDFLSKGSQPVSLVHRVEGNGLVTISSTRPPQAAGVDGQGSVCTLTFKAIGAGDSNIALVKVGAKNSAQVNLPAVGSQAVVHVK
ncbi:cohesin domain-containing protein [Granulicella tundricola]|uniref:Type II and III secretion system protein n=1 Tax=Granulicella tundricola (strain ATCC BAA-1859 / DSM 23138 / MP5ACTX9) TaxID=1198114 RepID=E8WYQ7_GRATM|nr:cohesin domain-containing protein [Granulicella tundricola]ADW68743.1 type II and III secretion system protein [Granulicella tundricola MP5ACTX9]